MTMTKIFVLGFDIEMLKDAKVTRGRSGDGPFKSTCNFVCWIGSRTTVASQQLQITKSTRYSKFVKWSRDANHRSEFHSYLSN